jgi:hypothetical protein
MSHITIENEAERCLRAASASLVLAPVTPDGTEAYWRTLVETVPHAPAQTEIVTATYTRSGHEWLADWQAGVGEFPASGTVIDVGGLLRSAATQSGETEMQMGPLSITTTDPGDLESLVKTVSDHLDGSARVVSVESLTAVLEHVDQDTAFRYLHLFTHRLRATDGVGFLQMDPGVHDEQTIQTFSRLFDTVVECSSDGDAWTVTLHDSNEGVSPTPSEAASSTPASQTDSDADSSGLSLERLFSLVARLTPSWGSDRSGETQSAADSTATPAAATRPADSPDPPDAAARASGSAPELTPKEERIVRLLYEHTGRLEQRAIDDQMDWASSTTSRVLSKMEAAGKIRRIQIGRGKTVFLAGYEPDRIAGDFPPEETRAATRSRKR